MCIDVLGDTPASQFVFVGLFYECICAVLFDAKKADQMS